MKKKVLTSMASLLAVMTTVAMLTLPGLQTNVLPDSQTLSEAETAVAATPPEAFAKMQRAAKENSLGGGVITATPFNPLNAVPVSDAVIEAKETGASPMLKAKGKGVAAVADLAGQYVMTYSSLTSSTGDGGGSVDITATGDQTIRIANFWSPSINVTATVDISAGTVTLPAQYLYTHSTYGAIWLAYCGSDGKPDYTKDITGTINANGTVSIPTWWGIFVKEGSNAGSFFLAAYNTVLGRANATMDCDLFQGGTDSYGVFVSQPVDNQVSVLNFGNNGLTVVIDLNRDGSSVIKQQAVREYPANGDFMTYSASDFTVTETGGVKFSDLAENIYPQTATPGEATRSISWSKWTALSRSTSQNLLLGLWNTGKITSTVDIVYPKLNVTSLEGSGTEADPYQIRTRDDLTYVSAMVEESDERIYIDDNNYYICAFKDKYFKVMNDIDMSGTNFTPIGAGYLRFGGHFDGNGKKISNLSVKVSGNYAGLFGMVDATGSLKNITMVNPKVECSGNIGGTLAAWSNAPVENCHVIGGSLIVTGQVCGGLIGSASGGMTGCSADGIQVIGAGGWCGGLVGQVQTSITDCSASGVYVTGYPGIGTSMGGVAGMILCDASNLSFSGTADGYRLGAPEGVGVMNGSLCGLLSGGKLSGSFATGTVLGRGTACEVGGLVGRVQNATLENSAFHGRVGSYYSRMTGGLVGRVMGLTNTGAPATNSFRNLYTASSVTLETYQYDRATGWAETLGTITEGGTLNTENIYYDSQMTDFKSANATPLTTAQLTSGNLPAGFDASTWNGVTDRYPMLKGTGNTSAADLAASAILLGENNSLAKISRDTRLSAVGGTKFYLVLDNKASLTGHCSTIEGDMLKINAFGADTVLFVNGNSNFWLAINVAPIPFEGNGTQESPYLIKTKEDIFALASSCNDKKQYFPGTYFLQANDIDLENDASFRGIASVNDDAHSRFAGIYDGGGHTIHGLRVSGTVWKTAPTATTLGTPNTNECFGRQGFIGRLDVDGVLRNISFAADGGAPEAWATAAMAVGQNYGLVENVRNYADVTAISCWVGGIVGTNEAEGRIRDCYNAGDITSGNSNAGGISGTNYGLIENCANSGNVTVRKIANFGSKYNFAGGITSTMSNGIVRNVLNVGRVEASETVGGIAGSLPKASVSGKGPGQNDIFGGVTYASVKCGEKASCGVVAGLAPNSARTEGTVLAYYDDQIAGCASYGNSTAEGITGLATARMISGEALQGLDAEYWQFDAGMYPVLKMFAAEPKLIAARKIILSLPEGITVRDLTANGTLSEGAAWSVAPDTYFTVSGNTLTVGDTPTELKEATLTGVLDGFSKDIFLTRVQPVPLTGDGTEASPYLIESTEDWRNLAAYIGATHDHFDGKTIRLNSDIEFGDGDFVPLFDGDADQLDGILDGAGHTVSGVSMTPSATFKAPIRTVGASGIVRNLTLKGSITSAKGSCGAFTAKVYGKLQNCVNEVDLILTSGSNAAAFGYAYANSAFENCVNKAHIKTMSTYVGGLVSVAEANVSFTDCGNTGLIESGFTGSAPSSCQAIGGLIGSAISAKLTRCYNSGSFKFAKPAVMYGVGGLVGWAKSATGNTDEFVFDGCYNETSFEAGYMVAGILANIDYSAAAPNKIVFRNCYNTGNITMSANTTSKTNAVAAGIAALYAPGTEIENCYNTGNIRNLNTKQAYAAGIVAYYKSAPTAALPMTVKGCHNTGEVSTAYNYAGGIAAYVNNYISISDCYNTGNVSATIGAAGIAANFGSASSTMERCWNSGDITVSESRAGGIAGQNTVKSTMTDCFNTGSITNSAATVTAAANGHATKGYGVGGVVGEGGGNMSRCYNTGTVKGLANVGGLIGRSSSNSTVVKSCYNTGRLDAPADTCGHIIGNALVNNGMRWKDADMGGTNSISDCYYLTGSETDASVNDAGQGLSEAALCELNPGEGWTNDAYTFPLLSALSTDEAKVQAARIIIHPLDTDGVIKHNFFGGTPEGLTWTSSIPDILGTDGNTFVWNKAYNGEFTMHAVCGTAERTVTLKAQAESGVSDIVTDGKVVVSETYFTPAGVQVPRPTADGMLYLVVRKYNDGTTETTRFVAR